MIVAEPSVEVLGVYQVRATDALIQDRIQYSYSEDDVKTKEGRAAAERECREFLDSIVLIEVVIHGCDDRFDVGDFTQRIGDNPDNWQVAYAEAFLAPDGEALASEHSHDAPADGLRVAFFLHFWDSKRPLASSYGDIVCPAVTAMPERLERLVPYENVS
jgi:hypothetical protein